MEQSNSQWGCCSAFKMQWQSNVFRLVSNDISLIVAELGDYLFRISFCPFCGAAKNSIDPKSTAACKVR